MPFRPYTEEEYAEEARRLGRPFVNEPVVPVPDGPELQARALLAPRAPELPAPSNQLPNMTDEQVRRQERFQAVPPPVPAGSEYQARPAPNQAALPKDATWTSDSQYQALVGQQTPGAMDRTATGARQDVNPAFPAGGPDYTAKPAAPGESEAEVRNGTRRVTELSDRPYYAKPAQPGGQPPPPPETLPRGAELPPVQLDPFEIPVGQAPQAVIGEAQIKPQGGGHGRPVPRSPDQIVGDEDYAPQKDIIDPWEAGVNTQARPTRGPSASARQAVEPDVEQPPTGAPIGEKGDAYSPDWRSAVRHLGNLVAYGAAGKVAGHGGEAQVQQGQRLAKGAAEGDAADEQSRQFSIQEQRAQEREGRYRGQQDYENRRQVRSDKAGALAAQAQAKRQGQADLEHAEDRNPDSALNARKRDLDTQSKAQVRKAALEDQLSKEDRNLSNQEKLALYKRQIKGGGGAQGSAGKPYDMAPDMQALSAKFGGEDKIPPDVKRSVELVAALHKPDERAKAMAAIMKGVGTSARIEKGQGRGAEFKERQAYDKAFAPVQDMLNTLDYAQATIKKNSGVDVWDEKAKASGKVHGYGRTEGFMPGAAEKDAAQSNRQAIADVVSTAVKLRSGLTVTDAERKYLTEMIGSAGGWSEDRLAQGLRHLRALAKAQEVRIRSTYPSAAGAIDDERKKITGAGDSAAPAEDDADDDEWKTL